MKHRIKEVIKEKGITQKRLSELTGITEVGLSKAINGSASQDTIDKIAISIGVDPSVLKVEESILVAKYGSDKTPLMLGNLDIPCYVLEDGTRVFSGRGIRTILGATSRSGQWLQRFVSSPEFAEYFSAGENSVKERIENPIKFTTKGTGGYASVAYGYEVTILIDICSAIIDGNRAGVYHDETIVRNADVIIRSVAKVGIIALVDEATGYDKEKNRAKDELQKFLNLFIAKEASKWVKTFDDSFFEMIYKMRNWTWIDTNKRPGVVGQWINDIVYERIGPMVLTELNKVNPKKETGARKGKHHQFLSEDIGHPKLREHLAAVQALGRASGYNWTRFMQMLDIAYPKQYQQYPLVFEDEFEK